MVLPVLLLNLGCGLKGDPLPPIRPPEPVAEEVPAETDATDHESEDSEPGAADSDDDGTNDNADEEDASLEAGNAGEPDDGPDEEDGDSAQGAA